MRTLNRVLVALCGVILLAGGLLAAAEIAVAFAGRGPWVVPYDDWYRSARTHDWQTGTARAIFVLITVAGVALVLLQTGRRRPSTIALRSASAVTYTVRRRSLEQSLARTATQVDGIEAAAVKVDRRTIRVTAHSHRQLPGHLQPAIQQRVEERLHELQLEQSPTVRITLRLRGDAS